MNIIVTGASGFLGQALANTLLLSAKDIQKLTLTDIVEPSRPSAASQSKIDVQCIQADLTSPKDCASLFTPSVSVVYLLHGLMSGAAEANLDLGLRVNIDSMRLIFDILRKFDKPAKVIFTSSTAVFGPSKGLVLSEETNPQPLSSYGTQKHITETLLNDFSRRGLIDGRVFRLPTVVVRPGAPSGAASSFASGILREPLKGERSVLPVARDVKMWVCSPRTVVRNLIHGIDVAKETYERTGTGSRILNLPGRCVSVQEMLDALEKVGGKKALDLVEEKIDGPTEKIVESWPEKLDTAKAEGFGFVGDVSFEEAVQAYLEDYGGKGA